MNTIRLVLLWLAGLSACLAQPAPAPIPHPILVGAAISQTGAHAELAADYEKGLRLWHEEVSKAGGLLGRPVELRVLDDTSQASRAGQLYARLIRQDRADLLIGPYGSAAALLAASEAERARRVMVNGAGPAAAVHSRAPRYLFQAGISYAAYGAGVLQIAAEAGYRKLFILARDDTASREMAEGTRAAAARDFAPGPVEFYRGGLTDFAPQVARARAAGAEAWIAFGDARDAAEMVKTFRRLDYAPPLFFARGSSQARTIELVGQDAEFSLGLLEFDARLGPAAAAFAKAYAARWLAPAGLAAAEGYAAGSVLAAAVRTAGTLDQERLRVALAELELATVLGDYRVAPENGVQTGFKPAVAQIRKGRPEVVWPPALETARPLLPYPQWDERSLLR